MANHKLKSAQFSINELIKQIQGYSYASKADMKHILNRCVKDLHELGFKLAHIKGLKPKHVHVLVEHWKSQGKNTATIKNSMSKLRKASKAMEKPNLVKPQNDAYQIEKRSYAPKHNKAIHHIDFSKCTDPHIRLSIEGQALFGLRREESMKFVLSEAWNEKNIKIKPSWTKGGIGRTLSITNEKQRQWLIEVSKLIKPGESLIPVARTYKQHLSHYQAQTKAMGVSKLHGLRHAYAQRRYHELTRALDPRKKGLICPIVGGVPSTALKGFEKNLDCRARMILTRELGHSRINITKIYLG
ncbi:MAG: integrase domain-containing protein [Legionella sp.]|nr:integrase domain-containing protein [Legionella sp.]